MSKNTSPVARIWQLVREERATFSSIYFYAILAGLIQLSLPVGIQSVVNFVLGGTFSASLVVLIIAVVAGVLVTGLMYINQMKLIEKIQQTRWKQDWLIWKTTNRIQMTHTELSTLIKQTKAQQQLLKQYADLLGLEWLRFRQRESSLFLVNARESRYQESRQKLLELYYKFRKASIEIDQVSGRLIR
jgi:ABC-type protease/lipase transport system fused ATPase/permease subunit